MGAGVGVGVAGGVGWLPTVCCAKRMSISDNPKAPTQAYRQSATEEPSPVSSPARSPELYARWAVIAPTAPAGTPNSRPIKIPRNR